MADWIQSENSPFLITILCSVTHDSYVVPTWYGPKADSQEGRYLQTIAYTDRFLAALDARLTELGLAEDTIFCVVGDHGEAFGEHGMMGHERIAYDEVTYCDVSASAGPGRAGPRRRSRQFGGLGAHHPGLAALMTQPMAFDGDNALAPLPPDRQVFFAA